MSDQGSIVTLAIFGVGAYLFLTYQEKQAAQKAADAKKADDATKPGAGGGGILDALTGAGSAAIGGLGAGVAGILSGAGAGLGKGLGALASDPALLRTAGSKIDDNLHSIGQTFGIFGKGRSRAESAALIRNLTQANRASMESFARLAWSYLSRDDVESWTLSGSGQFKVYFVGITDPFVFEVPEDAKEQKIAWAAEVTARTLGYFAQAGGQIQAPWKTYEVPAFSDENPFAPRSDTISEIKKVANSPEAVLDRQKRLAETYASAKPKLDQLSGELKKQNTSTGLLGLGIGGIL